MTRNQAPHSPPTVLSIAGSDSGGGAGIQADLKTIEACGGFGTSAITSVTAQNTTGVQGSHLLPIDHIDAQIESVLNDFEVGAAKTGMLATREVIETVTGYADRLPPLVVDPVMVAATGDRLLDPQAEDAYETLIEKATLVTPNADEASVLTGIEPEDEQTAIEAGKRLLEMGAEAALLKGGHIGGDDVLDFLVTPEDVRTFRHDRIETDATHGSGCTLSAAIATNLAHGTSMAESVGAGIDLLGRAVRYNLDVGEGPGAVHHLVELRERAVRSETAEAVESLARTFEDRLAPLIREGGTNVVGATPFAERPDEIASVEGKITRTVDGVRANRGVRFGASDYLARVLLAVREVDADFRFGAGLRHDAKIKRVLSEMGGDIVTLPESTPFESGDTNPFKGIENLTGAIDSTGTSGSVTIVLARSPDELRKRAFELLDTLDGDTSTSR